jgi:hypothetical protein
MQEEPPAHSVASRRQRKTPGTSRWSRKSIEDGRPLSMGSLARNFERPNC